MPNLTDFFFAKSSPEPVQEPPAEVRAPAPDEVFTSYNRHRRRRLDTQIGDKAREALQLLPMLLHGNQAGLPGFVDNPLCPLGIADYSPTHGELCLARKLFPAVEPRRSGVLRPVVELVAVMGSVGTIGFSGESDLDVWVCYAPRHVRGHAVRLYEAKVRAIEQWMTEHSGAEVHLFLQDAERVRENDFGEADLEGCGSALGALLKEEFYRTGILLAGKLPTWCLVPSVGEPANEADSPVDDGGLGAALASSRFLDLGPVARVPLGELFGAAIWQIVKSWKSPFKSALKMGLLEKAVRAGSQGQPLCDVLKERVLRGETPDPYRVLFDEVLAHYRDQGDAEIEDLLARCFYLKTGIRLDPDLVMGRETPPGDDGVLTAYVRDWGWGSRRLRHLNSFASWKFEWVQGLTKEIDRFFLRTYQRIRTTLDESGETQRITPRDLTILGRKLQAAYRRVPHKVETLHLVTAGVKEASLTLYQEVLPTGEVPWALYRGVVNALNAEEKQADRLRGSGDPLELLVWAAQNRLVTRWTRLGAKGLEKVIASADLESVGQSLVEFVEEVAAEKNSLEALLEKPVPLQLLVVPNFGREEEEVVDLGALWATSWGETFYRRWEGADAFRTFCEELLLPFIQEAADPARVRVAVPSRKAGGGRGAQWRLQRELPALGGYLAGRGAEGVRRRHVGPAAGGFFVLDRGPKETVYRGFRDREALLRYLSGVGPYRRVETRVESRSGDLALLKAVTEAGTAGLVDVFRLSEADRETLFVLDEVGNLIHFTQRREEAPYALAKLLSFLEQTLPAVASQAGSTLGGASLDDAVRVHTLVHEGTCRVLTSTVEQLTRARSLGLHPVGLTIERLPGRGAAGYVIHWGDQEIRSGDTPNPLEEARRRILQSRASGLDYDVFVTRLFLDERFVGEHCGDLVTTGHYLFYKKAIEQRLST